MAVQKQHKTAAMWSMGRWTAEVFVSLTLAQQATFFHTKYIYFFVYFNVLFLFSLLLAKWPSLRLLLSI